MSGAMGEAAAWEPGDAASVPRLRASPSVTLGLRFSVSGEIGLDVFKFSCGLSVV